ncbi:THAP domain-containing protein 8 [Ciconia boyciana]|uniref:THAP domain-containing protein 8 n=1 Tax=Ciconia boyciana TaxID=52775 RepID=UPI003BA145CD
MPKYCRAPHCSNAAGQARPPARRLSFYKFPLQDAARLRQWLAQMRQENWVPTRHQHLCSDHFEPSCFQYRWGVRYLRPDAVPTLPFPRSPRSSLDVPPEGSRSFREREGSPGSGTELPGRKVLEAPSEGPGSSLGGGGLSLRGLEAPRRVLEVPPAGFRSSVERSRRSPGGGLSPRGGFCPQSWVASGEKPAPLPSPENLQKRGFGVVLVFFFPQKRENPAAPPGATHPKQPLPASGAEPVTPGRSPVPDTVTLRPRAEAAGVEPPAAVPPPGYFEPATAPEPVLSSALRSPVVSSVPVASEAVTGTSPPGELSTEELVGVVLVLQRKVKVLQQRQRRHRARLEAMEGLVEQLRRESLLSEERLKLACLEPGPVTPDPADAVTVICQEEEAVAALVCAVSPPAGTTCGLGLQRP